MGKPALHLINFDDLAQKRQFMQGVQVLKGLWEVSLKQRKQRRSLDQNAYWHSAFVEPFREWVESEWGESIDHDQAHETLKLAVMDIDRVEGIAIMPSTKKLDTGEFSAFLEKAAQFLAVKCNIVVLPAEMYYEAPERGESRKAKPKAQQERYTSSKLKATGEQLCQQS